MGHSVSFFGSKSRPGGPCAQNLHHGHVGPCRSFTFSCCFIDSSQAGARGIQSPSLHSFTNALTCQDSRSSSCSPAKRLWLRLDNRTRDIIHHRPWDSKKQAPSATIVALLTTLLSHHRDDPQSNLLFRLRCFPCLPRSSIANSNWPLPFAEMAHPSLSVHR